MFPLSLRSLVGAGSALIPLLALLALLLAYAVQAPDSPRLVAFAVAGSTLAVAGGAALRQAVLGRLDRLLTTQAEESLRFDTAINHMSQGLCFFDGRQRLIVCNQRYAEMYRLSPELVRPGTTLREIVDHRFAAGSFPEMSKDQYIAWRVSISVSARTSDTVMTLKNGRVIAIHHQPMPDGGWVATHEDITERRLEQAQIERMARCDALTGLANRVQFRERLSELASGDVAGVSTAVLLVDLDRFKAVNDTLGHPVGDQLLRAVAERLGHCVRQNDLVARLGGDEFAIVQTDALQPAAARSLAERLVRELAVPFDVDDHLVLVGASVGVSLAPGDGSEGSDPDELLKKADLALYDAKAAGRGTYSFFRPHMVEQAKGRRALEIDLRGAEQRGELALHFQPIVELAGERVVCMEALLRWQHPIRGLVMPDDFIPLAEETGLIEPIGAWVLNEAFRQARDWPAHVTVAVNLSSVQFRSGTLPGVLAAALRTSGLAPNRVELEITESVRLAENSSNLAVLHALRAQGVRICLDDFGIGYSSLSYLRTFPFRTLKIDRSFVREVCTSRDAAAIVRAIASLGQSLDMVVTAEGVEHADQLVALRELGCTRAQGYLLGTPRPADEQTALLRQEPSLRLVAGGR